MIWLLLFLALSQNQSDTLYQEGNHAFQASQFEVAVAKFRAAVNLRPDNPEFRRALGAALASQRRFVDALPHLERACRTAPPLALACYQWGRTLFFLNRPAEALAAYELAAGSRAVEGRLHSARAQALDALGRHAEAAAEFRLALAEAALRPKESAETQLQYANFLARRGQHEAALWQFRQALRKTPFSSSLWEEQAKSQLALDRLTDAAESLEQALAHGPRKRDLVLLLAAVYARLGDEAKARTLLSEAGPSPSLPPR